VDKPAVVHTRWLGMLKPSPENDALYRPVSMDDPEVIRLAESIKQRGLLEPIIITEDNYILSGHRRRVACMLAGVKEVPVRVHSIRHNDPEFLPLLRECNRQRTKSFDEILRETVVTEADKKQAHRALRKHREQKSDKSVFSKAMRIGDEKSRKRITDAKAPFLEAVQQVLKDRKDFLPLTDRALHYALLNDPPLRHAGKPGSGYRNDQASYHDLTDLLTRARVAGLIPWDSIIDPTRPVTVWDAHPCVTPYLERELGDFLQGYWRDLQRSQPAHIEIIAEKMTVQSLVKQVAMRYCLPVTIGRGYSSIQPRHEMAERFRQSGKDKLMLLILSDHDPDGEEIAMSFARSMRYDFNIYNLHPVRSLQLPPKLEAKASSSNYRKFADQYGTVAHELEAVEPAELQRILTDAIDGVLDIDAFNAELDAEAEDAAKLGVVRKDILEYARSRGLV
jgi:hypothetical protein